MAQATPRPRVFAKKQQFSSTDVVEVTSPLDATEPDSPADFKDEMPLLGALPIPEVEATVYAAVVLRIPQSTYDEYKRVAKAQDQSVEEVMAHRLQVCKNHNALRGLWFSDSERGQLENIIQKWPLESAAQALSLMNKAGLVRIDDIEVTLTPAQKRVLTLAMYGGRTPKTFFESMIKRELRV